MYQNSKILCYIFGFFKFWIIVNYWKHGGDINVAEKVKTQKVEKYKNIKKK